MCFLTLAIVLLLFIILPATSAQTEVALVRGHFCSGNGSWNPEDFGWFYYDLDEGVGGESLSVDVKGKMAEKNHIVYASRVFSSDFEFEPWGRYEIVAFLGKPYLAGYPESNFTEEASFLEKGEMRQVLIDDDDVRTLTYNDSLPLLGGYEIALAGISDSGEEISIVLFKKGKIIDARVVNVGETYAFEIDDIPVILVHFANAMCGRNCGIAEVDGVFQVSDSPSIHLSEGSRLDNMKLTDISEEGIEFRNDVDLNLNRNTVVPLLDGLVLVVTDAPELVYYPQGGIFDYGVHEIRGPVYTEDSTLPLLNPVTKAAMGQAKARWSFENFSGFYFDPENLLGMEGLVINNLSGRDIKPYDSRIENGFRVGTSGMQYNSFVQPSEFEFKPWGSYYVVGFLGQLWFAGYGTNTSDEIGHINTISQQQIHQLHLDLDEVITVDVGRSLPLRDGYELALLSVSDDEAVVHLRKNGEMVESAVLEPNSTYVYKRDVDDISDLPVIAVHVQNVFEGDPERDTQRMVVDGIFQISDRNYLPLDLGNDFGEFEIVSSDPRFLYLVNPDTISLDRDSSQSLWYGMNIKVADNDTLRYYLYSLQYVVAKPELTGINYPKDIPSASAANFTMAVKAGEIRKVSVDILGPDGRTVFGRDVTKQSVGSEDDWIFAWHWNASELRLSDDGSPLLDASQPVPALLYQNESSQPVKAWILFDQSGRIASMRDGETSYYLSPYGLSLVNSNLSYDEMLANETFRQEYIKIEPGRSVIRFFDFLNGTARLNETNHTITGPLESIEPHAIRVGARPGRYELRLMIENAVNTLRVSDAFYFQVTEPEVRGVVLGSSNATSGEAVSVPLKVPRSGGEKKINISYDPTVVVATGATGPCDVPSYIDPVGGRISVVMPVNCSSTNLTFNALDLGEEANATTKLQVIDVKGFQPVDITNGSITVIPANMGDAISVNTGMTKLSNAPAFVVALAAFALMAFVWRRRAG
ncbi:MAG: S-layer protein domain-containing protein [Methanotrichaceae archaeon]|nr:S-layer protein domain-containing protein [Methanotrichaceae archaeon]